MAIKVASFRYERIGTSQHQNAWLDVVRGYAALAVCLSHLRNATIFDSAYSSKFWAPFYFVTGLGHSSVVVFFVLSGYFVGGSVLKAGREFRLRDYSLTRLTRLWTALLPALFFTLVIDHLTVWVDPDIFNGELRDVMHSGPLPGRYSASITTMIANFAFLHTIICPVFGSNDPLWSLAYEFWYYVLFPMLAISLGWVGLPRSLQSRIVVGVAMLLLFILLPNAFYAGAIIWLFGAVLFWLQHSKWSNRLKILSGYWIVVFFGGALLLERMYGRRLLGETGTDLILGLATMGLLQLLSMKTAQDKAVSWIIVSGKFLSRISYSLYVIHFPVIMLGLALFHGSIRRPVNSLTILVFISEGALLVMVGFLFWWLFEQRTAKIRMLAVSWLHR